ncbi:hypothetical protein LTR37_008549 [Vermiconidia calcicola]|uniref:Uncharacterized protein n=1 Tax=Vermiconidia calcicola TaxID=1690605 RepID=A0ACC3NAB3_9PEZI|nr:hypothetical protein LTR37_008549 [Vermiconidia calcicola]
MRGTVQSLNLPDSALDYQDGSLDCYCLEWTNRCSTAFALSTSSLPPSALYWTWAIIASSTLLRKLFPYLSHYIDISVQHITRQHSYPKLVVSHIVTHTTANTMSESQTSLLGAMDESRESESSTTDGSRKNAVCGLLTDEEFSLRSLHTSHEVDETSNPPFFDKLPAEIRNMVYDFAFGHRGSEAFDVVIKRDWVQERMEARKNRRYRSLQQTAQPIQPFPECPFSAMAVSQRFYLEAASYWLRETVLDLDKPKHLETFIGALRPSLAASITRIHVNWPAIWYVGECFANLSPCTALHKVCITTNECLSVFENRLYFVDDLGEPEFRQLDFVSQLLAATSLASVTLLPGESGHVDGEKVIQQWHKNVKALEDYINEEFRCQEAAREAVDSL